MKMTLGLILPTMMCVGLAQATPTPYPTSVNWIRQVTNTTDSSLMADDADPNKVWVLPPNVATASIGTPHQPSTNLGFCKEMRDLQTYSRESVRLINDLTRQRVESKKETDAITKKLSEARLEAASFAVERKLQAVVDLDNRIKDLEDRLTDLYKTSQTCKTDCEVISTEARNVENEKRQLGKDRRELANAHAADVRIYDKKQARVAALAQSAADIGEDFNKITQSLLQTKRYFNDMYSTYGRMEGIHVRFQYTSNWDENIAALRRGNPSFQFEKVITQNAKIFAASLSLKDIPGDRAILDYGFDGERKEGFVELRSGFPESLMSNAVLSLTGACPIQHPEYFDIEPGFGPEKSVYGLTITYDFPTAMKLQATAKYNMYKMYEKIMSSGSSGGFFSSRSWSRVEERSFFKDSFKVDWVTQDPANAVTEEQRLEVESEMRGHIMQRLASLALPASPDRAGIIAANPPPKRGGVVVAESLIQVCPGNVYCMAGAAILTSLDAIFGSSSSTASYLQTQDFEITESWSNSKVVMKPWITSYIANDDESGLQ